MATLNDSGTFMPIYAVNERNTEGTTVSKEEEHHSHMDQAFPHNLTVLKRVLQYRQLQYADQLFSTSDFEILSELHSSLTIIKRIFNEPSYVHNGNDQSVVELCLSRITSAIRETCCIETYAPGLVDVLEACLQHRMYMVVGVNSQLQDSPHCKIVSELLSTLFMYHSKQSVMTLAIPVAIKALGSANQELVRNTTSYLSLAAIHNGRILAQYSIQIIQLILNGNYSLVRVLPQVYPENREPFHAHLTQLFGLLRVTSTDISEQLSLLQLASMVTNSKPDLIIPHLHLFDEFLMNSTTCTAVLHIYLSLISMNRVSCLVDQLLPLRRAARHSLTQNNLATLSKTLSLIGRINEELAVMTMQDLVDLCAKASDQNLPILLKEIETLIEAFPSAIINRQPNAFATFNRMRSLIGENHEILLDANNIVQRSVDSLQSKRSSRIFPNDPFPNTSVVNGQTTIFNVNDKPFTTGDVVSNNDSEKIHLSEKVKSSNSLGVASNASHSSLFNHVRQDSRSVKVPQPNNTVIYDAPAYIHRRSRPNEQLTQRNNNNVIWIPPPPEYTEYHSANALRSTAGTNVRSQNHTYGSAGTSSMSPSELPLPPISQPIGTPLLQTPLQIGRDGRVRPIQRNVAAWWMPSSSSLNDTSPATTFPVHPRPTKNLHPTPPASSKSGAITGHSAKEHYSTEGLNGRTSRANSDWTATIDRAERGDVVKQFVDNRRSKIRRFVHDFLLKYPIPFKCSVEATQNAKKMKMRVHFMCEVNDNHCVFRDVAKSFGFKTKIAPIWLHLMFLQVQGRHIERTGNVLSQESEEFRTLALCYESLSKESTRQRPFVTIVTSAFPAVKEQQQLLKELQEAHFFDSFCFNGPLKKWSCFSCANPEKVRTLLLADNTNLPLLEGQLKEKSGRWKFFRRWHTKYFTLSSAALSFTKTDQESTDEKRTTPTIDLRKVRSVKSLNRGRKSRKPLPRAFQISTDDDTSYVIKATDRNTAEEWFQCLQIAVAHRQCHSLSTRSLYN